MKAILLLALLVASSYAFTPFLFEEGHKFLEYLRDNDHRCFVLMFKNSNAEGRKVDQRILNQRNQEVQRGLERKIKDEPYVTYAVIDVGNEKLNADTKADIDEFLIEARIDKSELDSYPITAVLDDGVGAYIWGPKQELVINRLVQAFRYGRLGNPHN
ncbi:unnamed protein product [Moneuplotes crassus]|uniref:Uncharacterized protein n=1 Tax=Euplotes crassus TaxID=5936 RepID=A0AAD2D8B5_EUPCR|nr:unnamed protein product [Moneuplotes crassus]